MASAKTDMYERKNSAPARLPRNQVSALRDNEGGEKGTRKREIENWHRKARTCDEATWLEQSV